MQVSRVLFRSLFSLYVQYWALWQVSAKEHLLKPTDYTGALNQIQSHSFQQKIAPSALHRDHYIPFLRLAQAPVHIRLSYAVRRFSTPLQFSLPILVELLQLRILPIFWTPFSFKSSAETVTGEFRSSLFSWFFRNLVPNVFFSDNFHPFLFFLFQLPPALFLLCCSALAFLYTIIQPSRKAVILILGENGLIFSPLSNARFQPPM